jgi:hypothetical protein
MVNIKQKTAFFTAFMALWLAATVVFSGVFVIAEQGHEHINAAGLRVPTSEDCQICFEIQIALRLIEAFARLGVSFFFAGFIMSVMPVLKPQIFVFALNPLALKVKFNC